MRIIKSFDLINDEYYGLCYSKTDQASDLIYINIPKNASALTGGKLREVGYNEYNYHILKKYDSPAYVVLRDPLQRWVSGIIEYLTRFVKTQEDVESLSNKLLIDIIFSKLEFDAHTDQQINFLQGIETSNVTFVWLDENYKNKFSTFFASTQGLPNHWNSSRPMNTTEQSSIKRQLKLTIAKLLDNNSLRVERIKDYYKHDYDLINSVEFYNAN